MIKLGVMSYTSIFTCSAILGLAGHCLGSNILLLPCDHHPHVNSFALTARSLIQAGHNVTILTMDIHKDILVKHGVSHIVHRGKKAYPLSKIYDEFTEMGLRGGLDLLTMYLKIYDAFQLQCTEMLEDKQLMKILEEKRFDFALVGAIEFGMCLYLFPYRLGIPYITLTSRYNPWLARVPVLPSAEGIFGTLYMSKNFSFKERILNTLLFIVYRVTTPMLTDDTLIAKYAPNKPATSLMALLQNSEMVLVNIDTLCLDRPRVTSPHYQYIAGMNNRPAEPLSEEFESFVNSADQGIIVVSFGSMIKIFPDLVFQKMLDGFRQIDQKVLMRYHGNGTNTPNKAVFFNVPNNVKLVRWLPQNDLLGHPKTKLFITHAGNNGQLESLYHGVPMLSIPLYDDQFYNAARAEDRGFSLTLDLKSFTAEELANAIKELITNTKYKINISKCMLIIKDFPSPQERITFWVEHVLKFGSSHLRPSYIDMPLWKFFMLDILVVFSLLLVFLIFITYWLFCVFVNRCCKNTSKEENKSD